ncbi:hypothetical protein [Paenibacillus athensensis]|uniref:hypothetical protein n=1 Tax=Paenibacillus athensensis TaxID=1967502 RepID=UPI001431986A|nr:hypothetical protein [Paenibacillus athensensis]
MQADLHAGQAYSEASPDVRDERAPRLLGSVSAPRPAYGRLCCHRLHTAKYG